MSETNNFVFTALKVVAWIIFVGLCIEAGALIVNFVFSLYNPQFIARLYQKLDLSEMYERSRWAFFRTYSLVLTISILKALLFYAVVMLVSKIDLKKPFNDFAAKQILSISYYTLAIGLVSFVARQTPHHGIDASSLSPFWEDSQAFILMAAVVYVIAQIFKRGVDLQNENDLTV